MFLIGFYGLHRNIFTLNTMFNLVIIIDQLTAQNGKISMAYFALCVYVYIPSH